VQENILPQSLKLKAAVTYSERSITEHNTTIANCMTQKKSLKHQQIIYYVSEEREHINVSLTESSTTVAYLVEIFQPKSRPVFTISLQCLLRWNCMPS